MSQNGSHVSSAIATSMCLAGCVKQAQVLVDIHSRTARMQPLTVKLFCKRMDAAVFCVYVCNAVFAVAIVISFVGFLIDDLFWNQGVPDMMMACGAFLVTIIIFVLVCLVQSVIKNQLKTMVVNTALLRVARNNLFVIHVGCVVIGPSSCYTLSKASLSSVRSEAGMFDYVILAVYALSFSLLLFQSVTVVVSLRRQAQRKLNKSSQRSSKGTSKKKSKEEKPMLYAKNKIKKKRDVDVDLEMSVIVSESGAFMREDSEALLHNEALFSSASASFNPLELGRGNIQPDSVTATMGLLQNFDDKDFIALARYIPVVDADAAAATAATADAAATADTAATAGSAQPAVTAATDPAAAVSADTDAAAASADANTATSTTTCTSMIKSHTESVEWVAEQVSHIASKIKQLSILVDKGTRNGWR